MQGQKTGTVNEISVCRVAYTFLNTAKSLFLFALTAVRQEVLKIEQRKKA
jgi:hypothetical protein